MITEHEFEQMALSFPHAELTPHFERKGIRITGQKMFATYLQKDNTANIFLSPEEQRIFCETDLDNIYPVPNKWGEKGATTFKLNTAKKELVMEALLSAYNEVLKKKGVKKKRT